MSSRALPRVTAPFGGAARRILVAGNGPGSEVLERELSRLNGTAPEVIGLIAAGPPDGSNRWPYLGDLDALPELLSVQRISEVAVCLEARHWPKIEWLARICAERSIPISIPVPHVADAVSSSAEVTGRLQQHAKRGMDIAGAALALVLAFPILLVTAIAILAVDGRPIFFSQHRAGRGGRQFKILKFRTMQRDADGLRHELRAKSEVSAGAFKMAEDPRVTRLGRSLRRTSIDELPQLWNVLKGEMSLVGPRPHPYDDVAQYESWHLGRLSVKPGITGLWQVELRGDADFNRWVEKDIEYIKRWSFWLDLKVIARTIPAVLRGTGR